ncbi:MAG: trypsin-like peptidase domain-containing protein [Verrucomicrobiota bacterium]
MSPAFRRFAALFAVFAVAFLAVTGMRTCRSGGSWKDLFAGDFNNGEGFRPEKFTLPQKAPLNLGDVEILTRLDDEYANVTEAVVPSVVSIDTAGMRIERAIDFWGRARVRRYPTQGQGSGVIVTKEGHVITNHHVIAGQQQIQVTTHDRKTHTATLVGEDNLLDIAVLKINGEGPFVPLKLGDSSQVRVGQMVFAVGNPFGLGETVTQGIISAKERSLSDSQRDLFQTDAAINPGNSGGPLVNLRGEIIGINVAIFSPDRENPGFQGVGFSIPSNDVKDALFQILERGRPIRGYLGVQMRELDPQLRHILDYAEGPGAAVAHVVPGSPAQTAGLQAGDVIVSMNGETIPGSSRLFALVQSGKPNSNVDLVVWRKGEKITLKPVLGESGASANPPPDAGVVAAQKLDPEVVLQHMGIEVRDLSVEERLRGFRGVVVTSVSEKGAAAASLKAGDLVIAVNGTRISGVRDFLIYFSASVSSQETNVFLLRDGRTQRATLPPMPAE